MAGSLPLKLGCHRYAATSSGSAGYPGLALRAATGAIQGATANAALFKRHVSTFGFAANGLTHRFLDSVEWRQGTTLSGRYNAALVAPACHVERDADADDDRRVSGGTLNSPGCRPSGQGRGCAEQPGEPRSGGTKARQARPGQEYPLEFRPENPETRALNPLTKFGTDHVDTALESLEEMSIEVSLLEAFTSCYLNLDHGRIRFRRLNRFHPSDDVSFLLSDQDRSFAGVAEFLAFLRSNSIPSYDAENMVDGVVCDLIYKFKDSREKRVHLFCPGMSPDQIHKDFVHVLGEP